MSDTSPTSTRRAGDSGNPTDEWFADKGIAPPAADGGQYQVQQDPDDAPVYMGRKRRGTRGAHAETQIRSVRSLLNEFYQWSANELRAFQEQAFAAGLYGNATRKDVPWGDFDEATFSAWETVVRRAAAMYNNGTGVNRSPLQVLAHMREHAPASLAEREEKQFAPPADVLDVRAMANSAAQESFGRDLTDEEFGRFEGAFRAYEKPQLDPDFAGTAASPENFAMNQLETSINPEEAARYDTLSRGMEFMDLLRGSGG